ncbi:MAG: hypothetical protein AAFQ63_13650, partial [Cyanobacteria bacterium J06621_11]
QSALFEAIQQQDNSLIEKAFDLVRGGTGGYEFVLIAKIFEHSDERQRLDILEDIDISVSENEDMSAVMNFIENMPLAHDETQLLTQTKQRYHWA